jgi:hypothetical protein
MIVYPIEELTSLLKNVLLSFSSFVPLLSTYSEFLMPYNASVLMMDALNYASKIYQ